LEKDGGEGHRKDDSEKENSEASLRYDKEMDEPRVSLLKGLTKLRGELGFSVIAYNMKRAISIRGVRSLIQTL